MRLFSSTHYIVFAAAVIAIINIHCRNKKEETPPKDSVLVFSKTSGFRHGSIPAGIAAIRLLGTEKGFTVVATENASFFIQDSLKMFKAVIFLNTTGDVLNDVQQNEMEAYIKNGGGFVGIHAAADCEYNWSWYIKMVGGSFKSHPAIQKATLTIVNNNHASTKTLPAQWVRADEWYNFNNLNASVNVLVTIDENSYTGGENGNFHPMAWYQNYDGGRAFYTALGHTTESYTEPLFLQHIQGGIEWAMGR